MALVGIQPNRRESAAVRSAVALEQPNDLDLGSGGGVYIRKHHCAVELAAGEEPQSYVLKKNDGETELQAAEQQETQLRG